MHKIIEKFNNGHIYEIKRGNKTLYQFKNAKTSTGTFASIDVLKKLVSGKDQVIKTQTPKTTKKKSEIKSEIVNESK